METTLLILKQWLSIFCNLKKSILSILNSQGSTAAQNQLKILDFAKVSLKGKKNDFNATVCLTNESQRHSQQEAVQLPRQFISI